MKHLKKHPKQQRMEEMKYSKPEYSERQKIDRATKIQNDAYGAGMKMLTKHFAEKVTTSTAAIPFAWETHGSSFTDKPNLNLAQCAWCGKKRAEIEKTENVQDHIDKHVSDDERKTWTGKEYLRSINDERHGWHMFAWGVLIVSLIASVYILTQELVCASASLEGKTVTNCIQKLK